MSKILVNVPGNPAEVSIGNMVSEKSGRGAVQPFSFGCCETVITTEGAILWHSEDLCLEAIAESTQSCHQPVHSSPDPIDINKDYNNFVDVRIKWEDKGAKTDADDDPSCRVASEKDPLLLDDSFGVQISKNECQSEGTVEECDTKAIKKSLRKNFLGILGQQDLLGMNITSEESKLLRCVKGKKYPETFICEFCGKVFKGKDRAYQFYYHRNREHTHETTFRCDVCSKEFWGDRELLAHRVHHKGEGHICHICGQSFNANKNLKVHLLIHAPSREHICRFCDKPFRRKDHLTVHERIHTGVRPYQCQWCDSGYPQKHQLKLHLRKCPVIRQTEAKMYAT